MVYATSKASDQPAHTHAHFILSVLLIIHSLLHVTFQYCHGIDEFNILDAGELSKILLLANFTFSCEMSL